MVALFPDLGPSASVSVPQGLRITGMSLQANAGGQREVSVWAEHGGEAYPVGTLSPEAPIVRVVPEVVASDELVLRHDGAAATVRFYGCPHPPPPSVAGEEEDAAFLDLDDGEVEATDLDEEDDVADDEQTAWVEFRPLTEEEEAERYDSDNSDDEDGGGEEEDEPPRKPRDGESSKTSGNPPLAPAPPATVVPDGQLLGPPRFAAVENKAGFMRLAAAAAEDAAATDREIVVLYRYTRFSRTWSGRRGVEACRRTKLHRLRFEVPPAGDVAGSLAWAGASLGPLIYPALFRRHLHQLWTILAAPPVDIPPRATRLQVVVDAAILRREDYTAERMAHVRGALEAEMRDPWPERCHVGMELNLPVPVPDAEEEEQGDRPAKRRKVAADDEENECSVCFFPLERGLAAWPCERRHVFHGECLEKTLARNHMCPLCRNSLVVRSSAS